MPPIPNPLDDPLQCADWLEILALKDVDLSSSITGDLEPELTRNLEDKVKVQEICTDVASELNFRAKGAAAGYPFTLNGSLLRQKENVEQYVSYIFCLLLSYFDAAKKRHKDIFPDRIFEHLSRVAAQTYLNGNGVRFGSPRVTTELPTSFKKAVEKMCGYIGEGNYNEKRIFNRKDDELDVVAWKHFPDERAGKLLLFGQCAAGWDWENKLGFDPGVFCTRWIQGQLTNPPLKSIFIPHAVASDKWLFFTAAARILFDRCRIASCTFASPDLEIHRNSINQWCDFMLKAHSK
jgi:hypothetical protein